ncbi:hypothetical protein DIE22_37385 [Burkholderia sp. Bp9142]|nr:hypothetical protein DIE22_37385 [Burkholderia sp. Bp9142]
MQRVRSFTELMQAAPTSPAPVPATMTDADIADMIAELGGPAPRLAESGEHTIVPRDSEVSAAASLPGHGESEVQAALQTSQRDRRFREQSPVRTTEAGPSRQPGVEIPARTASQLRKERRATLAREMTGNPHATAADYQRAVTTALARKMTGNPDATAADYDREMRKRKREKQKAPSQDPTSEAIPPGQGSR